MLQAVIFDFDGTVADTLPAITEGVNRTMRDFGFPEHTEREVRGFINCGARELIRRASPEIFRSNEAEIDRILAVYDRHYGAVYHHTTTPYAGVAELISSLHKSVKIGVLSNKEDAFVRHLCELVLPAGSVDAAQGVGEGDFTKPHPALTKKLTDRLGVLPEHCVLVGDSDVDIATARNAGMRHIGVTWGFRSRAELSAAGAVRLADTPEELARLIDRMHSESDEL